MVAELVGIAGVALIGITFIAIGAYIGTLRALEIFYSEEDSIFLSDDAGPNRSS